MSSMYFIYNKQKPKGFHSSAGQKNHFICSPVCNHGISTYNVAITFVQLIESMGQLETCTLRGMNSIAEKMK